MPRATASEESEEARERRMEKARQPTTSEEDGDPGNGLPWCEEDYECFWWWEGKEAGRKVGNDEQEFALHRSTAEGKVGDQLIVAQGMVRSHP